MVFLTQTEQLIHQQRRLILKQLQKCYDINTVETVLDSAEAISAGQSGGVYIL